MKKMMFLAACVSFATAANAQISIAPEAGINLANMHFKYKDIVTGNDVKPTNDLKIGVKVGANVNIPIGERIVVQPGLFYSIKGTKQESTDNLGTITETTKDNITLHYIDVPVNIQYMFNDPSEGRFFVGIGPYLGVAFAGHDLKSRTFSGTGAPANNEIDTALHFGNDYNTNNFSRFDFGGQVNAGYLLRSGIFFRGMYQQGIINLIPQGNQNALVAATDQRMRNSNITISVGYMIGGAPKSKGARKQGSNEM